MVRAMAIRETREVVIEASPGRSSTSSPIWNRCPSGRRHIKALKWSKGETTVGPKWPG
ncbi:cyclase/dehydrase superfamily protein [Mycobacterium xenopi 3993]|nr:cyclase/dehydrase superfamily protein [Mycobacterium xenopi 3993]